MYFALNDYSIAMVFVCVLEAFASPITTPSTSSLSPTQTSQSQHSIANCISHDRRWNNPCGIARVSRRSLSGNLRTNIDGLQNYINDTIKHYIAEEYFNSPWLIPYLESNQHDIFNRNFSGSSDEMAINSNLRTFIVNVDVLSNCGTGELQDIHLVTLLDELNSLFYSTLCSLYTVHDVRSNVTLMDDGMVAQKVHEFINAQNGLSQAMNIYLTVSDIATLLSVINQQYVI